MVPRFTIMEVACVLAFETLDDLSNNDILLSNVLFNSNAIDTVPCLLLCTVNIQTRATQLSISPFHDTRQEATARTMTANISNLRPPLLQSFLSLKMDQRAFASMKIFKSWSMALSLKRPPSTQTPIMSSLALTDLKDRVNGVWFQLGAAESPLQLTNMLLKQSKKWMHNYCAWQATSCSALVLRYAKPSYAPKIYVALGSGLHKTNMHHETSQDWQTRTSPWLWCARPLARPLCTCMWHHQKIGVEESALRRPVHLCRKSHHYKDVQHLSMMGTQRCASNVLDCIENVRLQDALGYTLSHARDVFSDLSLKLHDVAINTNYNVEWHRFQPSCLQSYAMFNRTHIETYDWNFFCKSWHIIGHMQERHKDLTKDSKGSCYCCRPKICIIMLNTNEPIDECEKWSEAHLTMAITANWLSKNDHDVITLMFVEFATACQEHLQASQRVDSCSPNADAIWVMQV